MRIKITDPFDDDAEDLDDETEEEEEEKEEEEDEQDIDKKDDEEDDIEDDDLEERDYRDDKVTLDALETEELEAVETNESATMLVDEASEIMAIRREEMALDMGTTGRRLDEFVCLSCFLLLKRVQLADRDNMLCADCV